MKLYGVELHSNEEVKRVLRQHPRFIVSKLTFSAILLSAPLYLFVPLMGLKWFGSSVFGISLFAALLFALRSWVKHRGTLLIITNQRVIDVERRSFFDKIVSEVPYESLSDVSYRSRGLFETLTGAGTITFQMIGGKDNVAFPNLADPSSVQKQVMELRIAHSHGTPEVNDPVEGVINTVKTLSPTEKRAVLSSVKKMAGRKRANYSTDG